MKDKNIDEWWVRSTSETCQFFNVTQKTLSNWEKKGAPKKDHGKWDIKELIEWKYVNGKEESAGVRKLKAEADLKESKAAQEAIKLALTEGRYIQVEFQFLIGNLIIASLPPIPRFLNFNHLSLSFISSTVINNFVAILLPPSFNY